MANIAGVLKELVQRVSRREIRKMTGVIRKASSQRRRDVAGLKRLVADVARRLAFVENQEKKRLSSRALAAAPTDKQVRFSARWLKKHREKLDISAADYGKLVGVTQLTIYNWEAGKAKPRQKQLIALASVRKLRKREAMKRLAMLGE